MNINQRIFVCNALPCECHSFTTRRQASKGYSWWRWCLPPSHTRKHRILRIMRVRVGCPRRFTSEEAGVKAKNFLDCFRRTGPWRKIYSDAHRRVNWLNKWNKSNWENIFSPTTLDAKMFQVFRFCFSHDKKRRTPICWDLHSIRSCTPI